MLNCHCLIDCLSVIIGILNPSSAF
uniref:Uncharacterized protein n=1 Tax=Rhizophora mucronata TaxID=61149 RepID=A0A2P2R1M6_RHIMU